MVGGISFYRLCPLSLLVVGFMFHLWQRNPFLDTNKYFSYLWTQNLQLYYGTIPPFSLSLSPTLHLSLQLLIVLSLFSSSFAPSVSVVTCFCCLVVPADDRFTCVVSGSECSGSGLTLHTNDRRQHLALCRVSNNR